MFSTIAIVSFYLCTFDITQKHGPVSRHVDGVGYDDEPTATVTAVAAVDGIVVIASARDELDDSAEQW